MAPAASIDSPAEIYPDAEAVLAWYDRNARILPWRVPPAQRAKGVRPDPYHVWLSEIMLQQTTIAAVRRYFETFTQLWPTVHDLAAAPLDDILVQWAGLGYYARARNLHACAQKIVAEYDATFPNTAARLRELPGIGDYTSAAVAAICHDEKIAVVDGNVDRVMARFLALPAPVREHKPLVRYTVQNAVPDRAGDFAQALMDIGAGVCAPRRANCAICPLLSQCRGAATGSPLAYPVAPVKKQRPRRHGHAFVIRGPGGSVFLRQRGEKGLLAKMTEVPNSNWTDAEQPVRFPFPGDWRDVGTVDHIFTHLHLTLTVWRIEAGAPLDEGWWADAGRLDAEALPSLFRKVLKAAGIES